MAVLVVCDSLRADLVDAQSAPHLAAMRSEGAHFTGFRGVFPSTTRTSAACIATGCRPASHGLLGNTMVLDEGQGLTCLSAGRPDFLDRLRRATGHALQRPTLHERVAALGPALAMSNVSPGAAYVHDPEGAGYVYHRNGSFGPGRQALPEGLAIQVGAAGDDVMTQRFCELLTQRRPPYAVLWLSEPDHTGHHAALGSAGHRAAIRAADRNVGQVRSTLDGLGLDPGEILFAVCSDHGMQTVRNKVDVVAALVAAGFKASPESTDVVVAPQGTAVLVHLADAARDRLPSLVAWLQAQDFSGRVVTGDGLAGLGLPTGTSLCIALSLAGDDEPNAFGVRGRADVAENPLGGESLPGHGQHGGLGHYEQRPFLAIRGGGFAAGVRDDAASLIDLAPTFLEHLGLPTHGLDGAVLARTGR